MSRPGQSDVESGALLDTTGRPVSGGEVATVGVVDEMPEASELGLPVATTAAVTTTAAAGEGSASGRMDVEGGSRGQVENSNLSSSLTANQKPNV